MIKNHHTTQCHEDSEQLRILCSIYHPTVAEMSSHDVPTEAPDIMLINLGQWDLKRNILFLEKWTWTWVMFRALLFLEFMVQQRHWLWRMTTKAIHLDRRNVPNINNPIQSDTESVSINQSEQLIHPRQHIWTQKRHLTRCAGFLWNNG